MNVLIRAVVLDGWEVEVDDMHHIAYVQATSRDTSSHHDRSLAGTECTAVIVRTEFKLGSFNLQSVLSLTLCAIGMDGCRRKTVVEEEVVNEVRSLLALHKHQGSGWRHGNQKIVQRLLLSVPLDPDDLYGG